MRTRWRDGGAGNDGGCRSGGPRCRGDHDAQRSTWQRARPRTWWAQKCTNRGGGAPWSCGGAHSEEGRKRDVRGRHRRCACVCACVCAYVCVCACVRCPDLGLRWAAGAVCNVVWCARCVRSCGAHCCFQKVEGARGTKRNQESNQVRKPRGVREFRSVLTTWDRSAILSTTAANSDVPGCRRFAPAEECSLRSESQRLGRLLAVGASLNPQQNSCVPGPLSLWNSSC